MCEMMSTNQTSDHLRAIPDCELGRIDGGIGPIIDTRSGSTTPLVRLPLPGTTGPVSPRPLQPMER